MPGALTLENSHCASRQYSDSCVLVATISRRADIDWLLHRARDYGPAGGAGFHLNKASSLSRF